jgi:hypothetical protein
MQTSVRYYITRADDQPVVRTIPVALRECEQPEPTATPVVETQHPAEHRAHRALRAPKIVRPALRRATRISSDKL